jgi:glycosyltransferase involved in cell wall biosynthesis
VRQGQGCFRWFERKDHTYAAQLRQRLDDLDLGDVVRFIGHVRTDDVTTLLPSAAVAVLPYRNATPSGVLNLLLAARIPIVARMADVHRG